MLLRGKLCRLLPGYILLQIGVSGYGFVHISPSVELWPTEYKSNSSRLLDMTVAHL